jgi:hypothetical protein
MSMGGMLDVIFSHEPQGNKKYSDYEDVGCGDASCGNVKVTSME